MGLVGDLGGYDISCANSDSMHTTNLLGALFLVDLELVLGAARTHRWPFA